MANFKLTEIFEPLGGMTQVAVTNFVAIGGIPAGTGAFRLGNTDNIRWRNQANDGDVIAVEVDASNNLVLGGTAVAISFAQSVVGTIQAVTATGYALLDEASTLTNPTLIPDRARPTTGIGGFPEMGNDGLSLIVEGVEYIQLRQNVVVFQAANLNSVAMNTIFHVRGDADNLTLLVRGFTTQTDDLVRIESGVVGPPTGRRVVVNDDGDLSAYGGLAVRNVDEGGTAETIRTSVRERHTLSLAATSVTTGISIPAGARLLGVSFNVDATVIDDAGDDTWSALFSGGSSTVLATAAAAAQNTKVDLLIVDEISSGVVEVTFTPNAGNFSAGIIDIIVYYEVLVSMANN